MDTVAAVSSTAGAGPRSSWSALKAEARLVVVGAMPFAIGALTLLLTLYLAFLSSQLQGANTALREYQDWAAQSARDKLWEAWKMYRFNRVLDAQSPQLAQLDAYQKRIDDARQMIDRGDAIRQLLTDSATPLFFPRVMEEIGPRFWRDIVVRLNHGDVSVPENLPQGEGIVKPSCSPPPSPSSTPAATSAGAGAGAGAKASKVALKAPARTEIDVETYFRSLDCFFRQLKISDDQLSYSAWPTIYQTKAKISLFVGWLLPGLYGLLGACVYVMRELVLVRSARYTREATVLTMLSLLLRIALGGLAGIVIGWFWLPGEGASTTISSIPFGVAFLAGFSIETLFSLLDRVNRSVGGDPPSPPAGRTPEHAPA